MPANTSITESEHEIMKVLWKNKEPMSTSQIMAQLTSKSWKTTTVATLLSRLCQKGAAAFESRERTHYYYPVLKESDYKLSMTKSFVSRIFGGSVKNLVAALYENKEMSESDIQEIKKMFRLD